MTRTKRKKRRVKQQKIKEKRIKRIGIIGREADRKGFASAQELMLYNELVRKGITVYHNAYLDGDEIDRFIPPKTVIEIGFRDDHLIRKWNKFTEMGYNFLYYSNMEIHNASMINRTVKQILDVLAKENDSEER